MFSAFRRPSYIHHPQSSSSHTGSSASGSVISSADGSRLVGIRSPDTSIGYESDAPAHHHPPPTSRHIPSSSVGSQQSGWESDTRKAVRWNPVSRLTSKQVVVASGYASETPAARASVEHERPTGRSRTYSNSSRGKMSSAGGSQSGHGVAGSGDDFQMAVDRLLRLNARTFAITGTVPLFAPITLFFQTPTGSCHLLRFPSESSIPSRSFDAFLAACEPVTSPIPSAHGRSASTAGASPPTHHTFRSNPARPINTSFDIASHPILETVRRTLFPTLLAEGSNNYLVASLNRVDVFCPGASSAQPRGYSSHRSSDGDDEPVAHIIVTLPYLEAIKRLALKSAGDDEDLSVQIEEGGGVPLDREGIVIATGKEQGKIGRERVAIMEARQSKLEYLHVNVCLVVYVH
ncbi:hypothetical protein FRC01_004768 [Tulasnella sp. 417]|nr:hypothetical protein FRC01_004768 [Tulasnella sp. 417]